MNHIYLIRLVLPKCPGYQTQKYGMPIFAITGHIYREMLLVGRKNIYFILNLFPSLPKENMERKLERARDTYFDLLSICLSRSFDLMRFDFCLR